MKRGTGIERTSGSERNFKMMFRLQCALAGWAGEVKSRGCKAQGRGPENFDGFPLAPDSGLTNADAVIERGDLDDFFQYGKAVNGKEE